MTKEVIAVGLYIELGILFKKRINSVTQLQLELL
jgi:hypothetical protein